VAGEYCWAMTQVVGRSCNCLSVIGVLEMDVQWTTLCVCLQIQLALHTQCNLPTVQLEPDLPQCLHTDYCVLECGTVQSGR
jgi:hypothetical protein